LHACVRVCLLVYLFARADEEYRLLYMLHEFHKGLANDCVRRADECSKCPQAEELRAFRWIQSRETRQPIAYRMQLKETTYFVLSHPLSRFMRQEDYNIGGEDAEFCAKLGARAVPQGMW
jgi:hypothetical protein